MPLAYHVAVLSASNQPHVNPYASFWYLLPDLLTFPHPAHSPRFPWPTISNFQHLDHVHQVCAESFAVECMIVCTMTVVIHPASHCAATSVSNGSGLSLQVWVRVGTEPAPDLRYGLGINPNCRFGYGSVENSLLVWVGRILRRLSSRSIGKYTECDCLCCLILVLDQNRLFDIQESQFACFAGCDIDNIWIHVFPLIICIFDLGGGQ